MTHYTVTADEWDAARPLKVDWEDLPMTSTPPNDIRDGTIVAVSRNNTLTKHAYRFVSGEDYDILVPNHGRMDRLYYLGGSLYRDLGHTLVTASPSLWPVPITTIREHIEETVEA